MTVGTIFTLFVVPSLYILIAKQHTVGSVEGVAARELDSAEALETATSVVNA